MNKFLARLVLLLLLFLGQFSNVNAQDLQPNGYPMTQIQCQQTQNTNCNNEIIFSQKVYPINAIDPTMQNNSTASSYPGLRS